MRSSMTCVLLSILAAATVEAAAPSVASVRPVGGRRGTEIVVTLAGARLADAVEVMFYRPGIAATKLEVANPNTLKATFQIAADCPLGLHEFRVRTKGGASELRTFSVGALPEVDEKENTKENNNDFSRPQRVPMNTTVLGVAGREDVDYFVVKATKGQRITAEVEGIRLGIRLFDPYVAIIDAKRFELARSDDAAAAYQDPIASAIVPEDGDYVVEVRDTSLEGDNNSLYRLHIGEFPRPRAVFPAGGKVGEALEVRWIGDAAGDRTETITLPSDPNPRHALVARDDRGEVPASLPFRLSEWSGTREVEPNDDNDKATKGEAPGAFDGIIERPGDVDRFAFAGKKGQALHVRVVARTIRSPLDAVLSVADRKGGNRANNDDAAGTPDPYVRFNVPEDGEYVVTVRDHLRQGGPDFVYRVEIEPVLPQVRVTPPVEQPRRRGTGAVTVAVPRGGRQSLLLTAERADFGGPLSFDVPGLPPGIKVRGGPMAASVNQVPLLFEAAADAPLGSTFVEVIGTPTETDKPPVASSFSATATLVYGQNNVNFWERRVDRIPVLVCEEAPFAIDLVPPKVPIVQGGMMELKAKVRRSKDFRGEIRLIVPWVPPGVSAARGATIPADKDEGIIIINANGNAPTQSWSIVVDGAARVNDGFVRVSSDLTPLAVAGRFLAFTYQPASVEQGKTVEFPVDVKILEKFDGEASVELMGLPNAAKAPTLQVTSASESLVFPIATEAATPAGTHKNLFCKVTVMREGEPIIHQLGAGSLRVDTPIAKPAVATPAVTPAKPGENKPLSRLEKLRAEAKARLDEQAKSNQP